MNPIEAIAFIEEHGIVLEAARGPVPSLAEAIVGEPIRGSWWGHAKGANIFRVARVVSKSPDVLVCKLIDNKITYIHRRLWPALVKLASKFPRERIAKVWDEHTESGAHVCKRIPFPDWVPSDATAEAKRMATSEAERLLSKVLSCSGRKDRQRGSSKKRDVRRTCS